MGASDSAGSGNNHAGRLLIKRLVDLFISSIALAILAIPFLVVAAVIKLNSKGPVFFRQERMGKNAKPFVIFKFRTMKAGAETVTARMDIDSKNPNVTSVGSFLRRWGLDELPQLLNIFAGHMSLVGPRPTVRYHVEQYDEVEMQRLDVKPGLTGWAQVKGRNKLNWRQKIELDIWYVRHWSLRLDAKILLLTPIALLRKDFAYADDIVEDRFGGPP